MSARGYSRRWRCSRSAACTPGGAALSGGGGGGANVTVIDVNLTLSQPVSTPYGQSGGMTPPVTKVAVGSAIQL